MSRPVTPTDLEQVLQPSLFQGLSVDDLTLLLDQAVVVEEAKGSLLFSQGDVADRFYVLLQGRVKLFTANEDGEESVVEIFSDHQSFAEAAMFSSARFPVNCEVLTASKLMRIEGRTFLKALHEQSEISRKILAKLAGRYRHLLNEVIQLKTQSPAQRLGALFLSLVDEREGVAIDLPYDKHLIAARVGMKPESLSRALNRLREIGVNCQKHQLVVADLEKLRQFCSA